MRMPDKPTEGNELLKTVMIVEDHPMFREALANAIKAEDGYRIIALERDGESAVKHARVLKPDVIVMDINLPVMNGIEAIRAILADNQNARILSITSSTDENVMIEAVQAGALGYILKDSPRENFIKALADVAAGMQHLPPDVVRIMMNAVRSMKTDAQQQVSDSDALTPREREVLQEVGEGWSNKEIADKLVLSESTVRVHIFNILFKLNLENRNQAIIYAMRQAGQG